jgi:hypothetical protein
MAFGRTIILLPTDRRGTLGGVQQRELLGTDRLPLGEVTPTTPRYLGQFGPHSFVQVTNFDLTPSSTSQRDCIKHALELSKEHHATLVMTALHGTGPHHGHPTFSAVRSLLMGALSFYWKHRDDPAVPWLALVIDPTSQKDFQVTAWLRRLPTAELELEQLLEADQIRLAVGSADYRRVGRSSTLKQVVRQVLGREMPASSHIGIQLGHEDKPVMRRSNGGTEPFRYPSDIKLRDTIIEDGDRLLLF